MVFTKLQALGNDFLLVASSDLPAGVDPGRVAVRLCDRHYGAGADGVIVTAPGDGGIDCASRIFNADGSEAEVSGNGTRCVAAWLDHRGAWPAGDSAVRIATGAGTRRVRRIGREVKAARYEMEMGVPRFASDAVPMALTPPRERVVGYPLDVDGRRFAVTVLSVGNPHCSIVLDDLESIDFRAVGAAVERHALFPERVNVEFVEVLAPDRIRARFWERGVGATLSSGTGSCAAALAATLSGRAGREVAVETPAGVLDVTWREDDVVLLTGPVEWLYTGQWEAGFD
jgi:diaminopimelate epimerase